MDDVRVVEAAHHVSNGIGLTDMRQKLVTQSLAFGSARHQPGNVHELDVGGQDALRTHDLRQRHQPGVGDRHDADIGIDGTERIVLGRNGGARQGIEQRRFAHVGQADDTALNSHNLFACLKDAVEMHERC